jgi:excisionase family DNA binding protein
MTDTKDLLTVSEAAEALNASSQTIRNWIRAERLEGVRIGHRFLIPRESVERMRGDTSPAPGQGTWAFESDDAPVRLPRAGSVRPEPGTTEFGG